ncbi:MAG: energy-converting hydrogenase B subunit J [Methanothermobacter sp.]|nr:energy-converting hydrogenase B subunit J [Methanothermobacter sp.]
MLYVGPSLFGFLIGFILGTRIKEDEEVRFPLSSYIVILIAAILMAWQLGPFPYYHDLPLASGFMAAFVGIIAGRIIRG